MAANTARNPKELKDVILRRLGAPIINVELTEDMIYDCIQRALELFGEYHYDGLNKGYQVIHIGDDEIGRGQFKNGVFDFSDRNIFAVTQIVRTNVGSLTSMDGNATYPWFTDFLLGMAGINGGMGSSCNKAYGPNAFGADLGYFTQLTTYWSMMQDMLAPLPDFWFNDATGQLKIMGNFQLGDVIVVECWTKSYIDVDKMVGNKAGYGTAGPETSWALPDVYDNPDKRLTGYRAGEELSIVQGSYNNRWVKDYAHILAKELLGQVLARHQGMQLPGGVTLNGERLIEEARLEKEYALEQLYLLDPPTGVLVG
ncbi:head completion, neck hetero-dimeric protein [Enterobacter phage vB-EclM_KMB17]|nr:head completion, neck hetero-dimeric protein [Enterobacter phage vB-EclM_KMB17]WFG78609.1 head-tail adaptor [Enterobacter phage vB_VIPECLOM01]WFG78895.1 head-tail adaptor [Enterobacter phage vB_VIPECLUMC02]